MSDYGSASHFAVTYPDALRRVTIRCPWKRCDVGRLQVTPQGRIFTVSLRGAPTGPLPIPGNAPEADLSRLPLKLLRTVRTEGPGPGLYTKGRRNFCYVWEDPMPDVTWTMVCRCGSGVVTTDDLVHGLAAWTTTGAPVDVTYLAHPRQST